jgi:hypothetical protein
MFVVRARERILCVCSSENNLDFAIPSWGPTLVALCRRLKQNLYLVDSDELGVQR